MYENGRYAALDIGTVTCRMLVADVIDGSIHELDREYRITDLGVGVDATGTLQEEAMDRVMSAVDTYLAVLADLDTPAHPVRKLLAMATSAARDASNAAQFTERLAVRGVQLAVIPGQREAALTFMGASSDFPNENLLVVDIGGGSTELVAGRAGAHPVASHSFNVGCRRVTERFFHADPPTPDQMEQVRLWIRQEMGGFFAKLADAGFAIDRLVAVAGTATSVVSIRESMKVYNSERVHKALVTDEQLRAIEQRLAAQSEEERRATVGLDPKRAGVIVAGFIILEEVLALAGVSAYTVSESDILHGMILEAAREED